MIPLDRSVGRRITDNPAVSANADAILPAINTHNMNAIATRRIVKFDWCG